MGVKEAVGHFSEINGSDVRIMYTPDGSILGTITKVKGGYRVSRIDGKVRLKEKLSDAYKTIRRSN